MSLQEVIESCDQLALLHEQLIEMGERKKKILIDNDVQKLSQLVQQETKVLKRMEEWDEKRLNATKRFLKEKGIPFRPDVTLADLAEAAALPDEKKALLASRERLVHSIERLKEMNSLNRKLIEQSLDFIRYSLDVLTGTGEDGWMYQHPAQLGMQNQRSSMFDKKA